MDLRRCGTVLALAALCALQGCGSSAPPQVLGTVEAPNGDLALRPERTLFARLADFVVTRAYAMTGLDPVGQGVQVHFQQIDASGNVVSTLATVQTGTDGGYGFTLATDEGPSSFMTFAVGVSNSTRMRAFFTSNSADINPTTEATVRLVLDSGFPLGNFSPSELAGIQGDVDQATVDVAAGNDIATANTNAEDAAAADEQVQQAITQAGES